MIQLDVGDVLRVKAYSDGYRAWKVVAILLGGENQESVAELECLDMLAPTTPIHVPIEILDAANLERNNVFE